MMHDRNHYCGRYPNCIWIVVKIIIEQLHLVRVRLQTNCSSCCAFLPNKPSYNRVHVMHVTSRVLSLWLFLVVAVYAGDTLTVVSKVYENATITDGTLLRDQYSNDVYLD